MELTSRLTEKDALAPVSRSNPLPVDIVWDVQTGITQFFTKQVSVGTAVTLIAAANPYRRSLIVTQITGTQQVFVGPDSTTSLITGHLLGATSGQNIRFNTTGAIYGIAATGAQTVSILEEVVYQ